MNRFDRLQAILLILKSRRMVKGEEIAEEFGISLRTVYRDLKSLMESGVPIYAEAGYGYSLDPSFVMKPVSLTSEEAISLYFGALFTSKYIDKNMSEHSKTAIRKIQSILDEDTRDHVENLSDKVLFTSSNSMRSLESFDVSIGLLQDAIVKYQVLDIEYFSNYSKQTNHRKIEPLGIFLSNDSWHLAAFCQLRQDYRDFRIDRIKSLQQLNDRYEPHHDFKLEDFVKKSYESMNAVDIKLEINQTLYEQLKEKSYFQYLKCTPLEDAYLIDMKLPITDWLIHWILSFGSNCLILEPKELTSAFLDRLNEIQLKYSSSL